MSKAPREAIIWRRLLTRSRLEGSYHLEDEDVLAENSYKGISDTIQKLVVDSVNQELDQILSNLTLAQMSGYYSDHYDKQEMYYI